MFRFFYFFFSFFKQINRYWSWHLTDTSAICARWDLVAFVDEIALEDSGKGYHRGNRLIRWNIGLGFLFTTEFFGCLAFSCLCKFLFVSNSVSNDILPNFPAVLVIRPTVTLGKQNIVNVSGNYEKFISIYFNWTYSENIRRFRFKALLMLIRTTFDRWSTKSYAAT